MNRNGAGAKRLTHFHQPDRSRSGIKTTPQADKPQIAPKLKARADEKAQSAGGG